MKTSVICLRIAGFICILFTIFHSLFGKLFGWKNSLSCLSVSDRAIMLTFHYAVTLLVGYMAFVLLFQTKKLLESPVKNSLILLFALFFAMRIVTEFTLFDNTGIASLIITIMCTVPIGLLICPLLNNN